MKELIRRLTKAAGPDRGLDGMIARDVLGWLLYFDLDGGRVIKWHQSGGHWHLPGDPCDGRHPISAERNPDPPCFTASADDALTLINLNNGWMPHIDADWRRSVLWWEVSFGHMTYSATEDVWHTSLPIALCISALLARIEAGVVA